MRVVPSPQTTFSKSETSLYFQITTDMEINNPMFVQKILNYTDIYRSIEFYKQGNKKFHYIVTVEESNELDAYKLIAKYFLDWLNELDARDLTECGISTSLTMWRIIEQIDLEVEEECLVEELLEKVASYAEELKLVIKRAYLNDLYYQKWDFEEDFLVTTYNFNVVPNQLANEIKQHYPENFNY